MVISRYALSRKTKQLHVFSVISPFNLFEKMGHRRGSDVRNAQCALVSPFTQRFSTFLVTHRTALLLTSPGITPASLSLTLEVLPSEWMSTQMLQPHFLDLSPDCVPSPCLVLATMTLMLYTSVCSHEKWG